MELRRYWFILTKWLWLIALTTLVAAGVSYVVSRSTKPTYSASATILVNQAQNPATPDYNSVLSSERLAQTYSQLIQTRPILEKTISDLGLAQTPEQLAKLIDVKVINNTQLIQISIQDTNAILARDIANHLAQNFIDDDRTQKLGVTANSQSVLQQQLTDLENQMKQTTAQLQQVRANSGPQSIDALQLQATLSQQQVTYSQLLRTQDDMHLAEASVLDTLRVVEPAVVESQPVSPKILLNVLLAAAVGLLIGLGAAFLIEYLDDTVKTPDDTREATDLTSLGTIIRMPANADNARLLVDELGSRSQIAEAYRVLRTNVDFARVGLPGNLILVTSANQSEGKTTTLANLAIVMAESGKQVIAIDSDLRRPMLHKVFGVDNSNGLTNLLLTDEPDIGAALQPTRVENLRVITSGPIPPNPSELLGSARMELLLARIRSEADLIVLDSPPVLAVTDPTVLAARVDGVVLVAAAGGTRVESLVRAKETLARGTARIIGVVLNKVSSRSGGYYYYHYYRYAYGSDTTNGNGSNGNGSHATANGTTNGTAKEPVLAASNGSANGHHHHHRSSTPSWVKAVRRAVARN